MSTNGVVSVQRDTQDFRSSVQWNHPIIDSHLRMEPELVGVWRNSCHSEFLGSNGQLFLFCQGGHKLVCHFLDLHHAGSRVMSWSVLGQYDTKWLKSAGEMTDPCGTKHAPGEKAIGVAGRKRAPSVRGSMPRDI